MRYHNCFKRLYIYFREYICSQYQKHIIQPILREVVTWDGSTTRAERPPPLKISAINNWKEELESSMMLVDVG